MNRKNFVVPFLKVTLLTLVTHKESFDNEFHFQFSIRVMLQNTFPKSKEESKVFSSKRFPKESIFSDFV